VVRSILLIWLRVVKSKKQVGLFLDLFINLFNIHKLILLWSFIKFLNSRSSHTSTFLDRWTLTPVVFTAEFLATFVGVKKVAISTTIGIGKSLALGPVGIVVPKCPATFALSIFRNLEANF